MEDITRFSFTTSLNLNVAKFMLHILEGAHQTVVEVYFRNIIVDIVLMLLSCNLMCIAAMVLDHHMSR